MNLCIPETVIFTTKYIKNATYINFIIYWEHKLYGHHHKYNFIIIQIHSNVKYL